MHVFKDRLLGPINRVQRIGAQAIVGTFSTVATAVVEAEAYMASAKDRFWRRETVIPCPLLLHLRKVRHWMMAHSSEVVTMVIGNADSQPPINFTQPMIDSGMMELVYRPPSRSLELDDWPTLGGDG